MAGIHFKKKLIHRCIIQRTTPSQSDSGEPVDSWSTVGTIDCRYVQKQEKIADERLGFMIIQQDLLLTNTGEDVQEEDRVINITLKSDGSVVDVGPFTIQAMLGRNTKSPHHLSFDLERVE